MPWSWSNNTKHRNTTPTDSTLTMVGNTPSATTNRHTLTTNNTLNTATTNPIDTVNTLRQLNPTDDPLASLTEDFYHTVTNTYATNITVGNPKSRGMESIFALQSTNSTRCYHHLVVRILVRKNRGTFELLHHKTRQNKPKQNRRSS